ncbi:myosin-11-like [Durio zibethinus]|uniref:Myosin-11-like n=1 Tax=Durio zibethinus TaxID=66656 RepID=A0A6P5WVB4_DURZI|nr:myosin-11-like [Durio zibethinus]
MAKKKLSHQSKDRKQQNPSQETHDSVKESTFAKSSNPMSRHSSMEDPNEKLQNLKSLNSLLVKEAFERRQQIESLVQAKEALEAELSERKELEGEKSEKNVSLELQNGLLSVYMETQMKEMGLEREGEIGALKSKVNGLMCSLENERERLSLACTERDLARNDFELQVNEGSLMKEKLMEMEKNERKFVEEVGKLRMEYDKLVGEKEELEKVKSSVLKEKDLLEKSIKDMEKEVELLRKRIENVVREKKEIEMEKNEQKMKIDEMEKEMWEMGEVISSLRKEEGILRFKVLELEKNCGEAMDREAERAIEIGALVEEKRAKERSIERLMEEKDFVSRSLEVTTVESEDRQRRIEKLLEESDAARRVLEMNEKEIKDMQNKIEDLLGDRNEIERVKVGLENENVELLKEVSELRNVVNRLQEACWDHEKKNKELVSEVSRFRDSFEQVTLERDNALKGLDEEKQNGVNLRLKVSEVEKVLEKTAEELAQKRTEWQNLTKEKKEMESHFGSMTEDKDRLQEDLLEAKRSFNFLRAKMESTSINYERALTLLKNTALLLCRSKDENDRKEKEEAIIAEQKIEDEVEPYAAELEAIKQAFKNKETVEQDLKQKVEFMEKSMVEAQKKKSFWTWVSSATTLLAAVTVAYVARGR